MKKTALIIGAGPAGLTAAYELVNKTDILPIIIEQSNDIGGISKTVVYKNNRIDIGGHRFFSKSDRVMDWWLNILPLQRAEGREDIKVDITYHGKNTSVNLTEEGPNPEQTDRVFLIRNRLSRIFYLRKFFDYPVTLNLNTIRNLGFFRLLRIAYSYFIIKIFPVRSVNSLEEFFISRFGRELYLTFFKDYTEKVWGVPCNHIAADWGAQRIKQLSVTRALLHAIKAFFPKQKSLSQKSTDTSLIERFMYPKYGPGQLWETVADIVKAKGGQIIKNSEVVTLVSAGNKIESVTYIDKRTKEAITLTGDYFFSTMPVKNLINAMGEEVPAEVKSVSDGLMYRDFITVGLLLNKLKIKNEGKNKENGELIPDNWIYIQERDVKLGRLQVFNNWSPYLVADKSKAWIGLEYFCNEGDELWSKSDSEFIKFAIDELHKIDIIDKNDVVDSTIIRMPKTYPAYFGTYTNFETVKIFTNKYENLFLIGRNGMHKYNNQDHSMLTAMTAVENIINNEKSKENIWAINTEESYHEKK